MKKTKASMVCMAVLCMNPSLGYSFTLPGTLGFPVNENANFAPQLRSQICNTFNSKVALINQYIIDNNLSNSARVSTDLCRYISLATGQIEDGDQIFETWDPDSSLGPDGFSFNFIETIDVTREIELIILSQAGVTQYLLYVDGDANLKKQVNRRLGFPETNTNDDLSTRLDGDNVFGPSFHTTRVENRAWESKSGCSADNLPANCIPGGAANSSFWVLDDSFPKSSQNNTQLSVTNSTGLSLGIGANGSVSNDGPALGLDFSFGYTNETSTSTETTTLITSAQDLENDFGSTAQFNVSPTAIRAAPTHHWGSRSSADELFGASTWRTLDTSSSAFWREIVNAQNCSVNGEIRRMAFHNYTYINRAVIDVDSFGIDLSQSKFDEDSYGRVAIATTECRIDNQGHRYRVAQAGFLF